MHQKEVLSVLLLQCANVSCLQYLMYVTNVQHFALKSKQGSYRSSIVKFPDFVMGMTISLTLLKQ